MATTTPRGDAAIVAVAETTPALEPAPAASRIVGPNAASSAFAFSVGFGPIPQVAASPPCPSSRERPPSGRPDRLSWGLTGSPSRTPVEGPVGTPGKSLLLLSLDREATASSSSAVGRREEGGDSSDDDDE